MARISFDALRDLARVVKRGIPKRSQYISLSQLADSDDKTSRFFQALTDSSRSEDGIAKEVFETTPQNNLYQAHKSQIKQQLLNSLFVLDLERAEYSELTTRALQNQREVFLAKYTGWLGTSGLAQSIAESGLSEAFAIEEWSSVLEFLRILRGIAAYGGDNSLWQHYAEEYRRISEIERAEQEAKMAYEEITCTFATTGAEHYEMAEVAEHVLPALEESYAKHQTFGLARLRFLLKTAAFQAVQNYAASLSACEEYQQLLDERFTAFANPDNRFVAAFKRLVCLLQTRQYDEARRAAEQCSAFVRNGTNKWFNLQEYRFLLGMHEERFDDARAVVEETTNHERFLLQPEHRRELWRMFRAHLECGQNQFPDFRDVKELSKHLRIFTKDKSGYNASMILLQILVLAERGNERMVSSRIETLAKYRTRYMKDKGNAQANALFNLLDLLGKDLTRFETTLREVAQEVEIFRTMDAPMIDGVQILPYVYYWDRLIAGLRMHRKKPEGRRRRILAPAIA